MHDDQTLARIRFSDTSLNVADVDYIDSLSLAVSGHMAAAEILYLYEEVWKIIFAKSEHFWYSIKTVIEKGTHDRTKFEGLRLMEQKIKKEWMAYDDNFRWEVKAFLGDQLEKCVALLGDEKRPDKGLTRQKMAVIDQIYVTFIGWEWEKEMANCVQDIVSAILEGVNSPASLNHIKILGMIYSHYFIGLQQPQLRTKLSQDSTHILTLLDRCTNTQSTFLISLLEDLVDCLVTVLPHIPCEYIFFSALLDNLATLRRRTQVREPILQCYHYILLCPLSVNLEKYLEKIADQLGSALTGIIQEEIPRIIEDKDNNLRRQILIMCKSYLQKFQVPFHQGLSTSKTLSQQILNSIRSFLSINYSKTVQATQQLQLCLVLLNLSSIRCEINSMEHLMDFMGCIAFRLTPCPVQYLESYSVMEGYEGIEYGELELEDCCQLYRQIISRINRDLSNVYFRKINMFLDNALNSAKNPKIQTLTPFIKLSWSLTVFSAQDPTDDRIIEPFQKISTFYEAHRESYSVTACLRSVKLFMLQCQPVLLDKQGEIREIIGQIQQNHQQQPFFYLLLFERICTRHIPHDLTLYRQCVNKVLKRGSNSPDFYSKLISSLSCTVLSTSKYKEQECTDFWALLTNFLKKITPKHNNSLSKSDSGLLALYYQLMFYREVAEKFCLQAVESKAHETKVVASGAILLFEMNQVYSECCRFQVSQKQQQQEKQLYANYQHQYWLFLCYFAELETLVIKGLKKSGKYPLDNTQIDEVNNVLLNLTMNILESPLTNELSFRFFLSILKLFQTLQMINTTYSARNFLNHLLQTLTKKEISSEESEPESAITMKREIARFWEQASKLYLHLFTTDNLKQLSVMAVQACEHPISEFNQLGMHMLQSVFTSQGELIQQEVWEYVLAIVERTLVLALKPVGSRNFEEICKILINQIIYINLQKRVLTPNQTLSNLDCIIVYLANKVSLTFTAFTRETHQMKLEGILKLTQLAPFVDALYAYRLDILSRKAMKWQ